MKEPTEDEIREVFQRLRDKARGDIIPKMTNSAMVFCPIFSDKDKDIWMALQLGLALLLDKPLVVLGTDNAELPARLRQVADVVIEASSMQEPGLADKVAKATAEMLRKKGTVQ